MIEQPAMVAARQRHTVWIRRSPDATDCAACAADRGCGAGWLLRWAGRRVDALPMHDSGGFSVGERVLLRIPERWLLKAAGAVYGAPLLGLLAGVIVGDATGGDGVALALGGAGFVVGASVAALLGARLASTCPLHVRRTSGGDGCDQPLRRT